MTTTRTRITRLEAEAQRLAKLAQFEFSPIQAAFYRQRAAEVMATAEALNSADIDAAAARMRGDLL
jgi:Asp-tRNA(Asn)/Glu-tRNA(Gln) amidotransferase C subunit